jgi:D-alanyl-D-alanine dipeptidase
MQSSKAKFPPQILKNRQLLKHILEKVGFTNYQFKPWHWSYGDSGWALRADRKTAIYGKIKPSSNFDNIKKMC